MCLQELLAQNRPPAVLLPLGLLYVIGKIHTEQEFEFESPTGGFLFHTRLNYGYMYGTLYPNYPGRGLNGSP